jgi:hypothetical protein
MMLSHTETYPLTDPTFLEDLYPVYRRMRRCSSRRISVT